MHVACHSYHNATCAVESNNTEMETEPSDQFYKDQNKCLQMTNTTEN